MREIKSREKGERGRWHLNEYSRGRKTSKERELKIKDTN